MEPNFVDFNSDIYSYEYFLQDDVCRLCWCKKPETEIISWKMKTQSHNKFTLFDKIQDCLDLDLTQMLFPQQACKSCCDNVEKFLKFRTDCKERERKLNEILKQKNENVKIEKEEILNLELIKTDFVVNDAIFFDGLHSDISDVDKTGKRCDDETRKSKKCKYKHKNTATFCRSCKIDCKSKESLSKHNDEWHGIEEGSEGKLYKCFGCGKKHTSIKARRSHEVNFCKDMKDGYKCSLCERFLPLRSMYLAHKKAHRENKPVHIPEDIFQCNKCSKLFKTKDCLRKHLAEHIKRNFICETCGRVFTRRDYLNKHKPIHTGTKHLSCPHCDYKTSQQSSLVVHIRRATIQLCILPSKMYIQFQSAGPFASPQWN
nr:zinc finger protein 665-like isoform X1 [Plodia interpunctella]